MEILKKWDICSLETSVVTSSGDFPIDCFRKTIDKFRLFAEPFLNSPLFVDQQNWTNITIEDCYNIFNCSTFYKLSLGTQKNNLINFITGIFCASIFNFFKLKSLLKVELICEEYTLFIDLVKETLNDSSYNDNLINIVSDFIGLINSFQCLNGVILESLNRIIKHICLDLDKKCIKNIILEVLSGLEIQIKQCSLFCLLEDLLILYNSYEIEIPNEIYLWLTTNLIIPSNDFSITAPNEYFSYLCNLVAEENELTYININGNSEFISRLGILKSTEIKECSREDVQFQKKQINFSKYCCNELALNWVLNCIENRRNIIPHMSVSLAEFIGHLIRKLKSSSNRVIEKLQMAIKKKMSATEIAQIIQYFVENTNYFNFSWLESESKEKTESVVNEIHHNLSILKSLLISPKMENVDSNHIHHRISNELLTLLIGSSVLPVQFIYIKDTQTFEKENWDYLKFSFPLYQMHIDHIYAFILWILKNSQSQTELLEEFPIVLVPEGIPAPIQYPKWVDNLLFNICLNSISAPWNLSFIENGINKSACKGGSETINDNLNKTSSEQNSGQKNNSYGAAGKSSYHEGNLEKTLYLLRNGKPFEGDLMFLRFKSLLKKIQSNTEYDSFIKLNSSLWICSQIAMRENLEDHFMILIIENLKNIISDYQVDVKSIGIDFIINMHHASPIFTRRIPFSLYKECILTSFTFRELPLIQKLLEGSIILIEAQDSSEIPLWSGELIHAIIYELEFLQKSDLIVVYLKFIQGNILKLLGKDIIYHMSRLIARLIGFFDFGELDLIQESLVVLRIIVTLSWPIIEKWAEIIVGGLGCLWIDHFSSNSFSVPDPHDSQIEQKISLIRDSIISILGSLSQLISNDKRQKLKDQLREIAQLSEFSSFF